MQDNIVGLHLRIFILSLQHGPALSQFVKIICTILEGDPRYACMYMYIHVHTSYFFDVGRVLIGKRYIQAR